MWVTWLIGKLLLLQLLHDSIGSSRFLAPPCPHSLFISLSYDPKIRIAGILHPPTDSLHLVVSTLRFKRRACGWGRLILARCSVSMGVVRHKTLLHLVQRALDPIMSRHLSLQLDLFCSLALITDMTRHGVGGLGVASMGPLARSGSILHTATEFQQSTAHSCMSMSMSQVMYLARSQEQHVDTAVLLFFFASTCTCTSSALRSSAYYPAFCILTPANVVKLLASPRFALH